MRVFGLALVICSLPATTHAELMKCMSEQTYLYETIGEWEKQYSGPLIKVVVMHTFGAIGNSSMIDCHRASGEASIFIKDKSCHIIQGKGKAEVVTSNKLSETVACWSVAPDLMYDNDKSCMIECN